MCKNNKKYKNITGRRLRRKVHFETKDQIGNIGEKLKMRMNVFHNQLCSYLARPISQLFECKKSEHGFKGKGKFGERILLFKS